jgi:hypothetical protein
LASGAGAPLSTSVSLCLAQALASFRTLNDAEMER